MYFKTQTADLCRIIMIAVIVHVDSYRHVSPATQSNLLLNFANLFTLAKRTSDIIFGPPL